MEIKVGDKFKVLGERNSLWTSDEPPIYTVTEINGDKIVWDCVGRKMWYKRIGIEMIREHVLEIKDLIKIN